MKGVDGGSLAHTTHTVTDLLLTGLPLDVKDGVDGVSPLLLLILHEFKQLNHLDELKRLLVLELGNQTVGVLDLLVGESADDLLHYLTNSLLLVLLSVRLALFM